MLYAHDADHEGGPWGGRPETATLGEVLALDFYGVKARRRGRRLLPPAAARALRGAHAGSTLVLDVPESAKPGDTSR